MRRTLLFEHGSARFCLRREIEIIGTALDGH
jgi:hypothetical protein